MYDIKESESIKEDLNSNSTETFEEEFDFFYFMYPEETEATYKNYVIKHENEDSESSPFEWYFEFCEQKESNNTIFPSYSEDNKCESVSVTTLKDNRTPEEHIESLSWGLVPFYEDDMNLDTQFNEEPYDYIQIFEDSPALDEKDKILNEENSSHDQSLPTFNNTCETLLNITDDHSNTILPPISSTTIPSKTSKENKGLNSIEISNRYVKQPQKTNKTMSVKTANGIFLILCLIIYFIFILGLFLTKIIVCLIILWVIPLIPTDIRFYKDYSGFSLPVYKNKTEDNNLFDKNDYYTQIRIGSCLNGIITLLFLLIKLFFSEDNKKPGPTNNNPATFDGFNDKWKETLDNFFPPGEIDVEVLENLEQLRNRQNQEEHYPKQYSSNFERNLFNEKCNVNSKEAMKKNWLKYENSFKPFIRGNKGYNPLKWIIDTPDTILTTMFGRLIDNQYSMNKKLIPEYERFHEKFVGEENIIRNTEPLPNSINYISHPRNFLRPMIEMNFDDLNEIYFKKLPKNSKITIAIWDDLQEERTPEFFNLMNNIIHWNLCLEIKDYDLIMNPEKHTSEIVLLKKAKKQKTGGDKYSLLFEKGLTYKITLKEERTICDIFIDIGRYCMMGYRGRVCISPFFGHFSTLNQLRKKGIKPATKTDENAALFLKCKNKLEILFKDYKTIENEFKGEDEI